MRQWNVDRDEHICLLVQRAGVTTEFPLRRGAVQFGYAPGGAHDLILYDSLLDDVQGIIEFQDGAKDDGFTPYRLRAKADGIEIEGVKLPAREAASIRLKIGQRIRVGRNYLLTVAEYQNQSVDRPVRASAAHAGAAPLSRSVPAELQSYLAESHLFLQYLPEIYRAAAATDGLNSPFLNRFLALFESAFLPIKWSVESFALFMSPLSAPPEALSWLADWYGLPIDFDGLPEGTQRSLLQQMPHLLDRQGTRTGLKEMLTILAGGEPTIEDETEPRHFTVALPAAVEAGEQLRSQIKRLIEWYKPAHTTFELK